MSEGSLIEQQRARHLRALEVLARVEANQDLMDQVEDSLAAIARGERGVPLRQILEEERARREPEV